MAITQKNPSTFSYADLSEAQTYSYKRKADITISNYDNTSAPVVKVGSTFENNGSLYVVDTSDETPTGYSGISNSATFYLYFNASATAFIYSSTAPTWSDSLQGWYNGNDRAFFSMYKDSGGTLYENKTALNNISRGIDSEGTILRTKVIEIGDWDMDSTDWVSISHGLSVLSIRSFEAIIRKDGGVSQIFGLSKIGETSLTCPAGTNANINYVNTTGVLLTRLAGGDFDSTDYDATSYNRGWVIMTYEV